MDSDNKFFLGIWAIVGLCFVIFVATMGGCQMHQQKLIAESPDPVAASCAINAGREPCMSIILRSEHK